MNDQFINWNLGSVTTVFCRLATAMTDARPIFARMRFERFNTLEFPAGGEGVEATFLSNKDLHFIRNRSRAAGWSQFHLPLVRVKRAETEGEARIDFMFPATVVPVPGDLPIMVDKTVLEKVAGAADEPALRSLLKDLVLDSGFAKYLVRQAPGFIEDEAAINVVKLLLPAGYWLVCRLMQNNRGVPYLFASLAEDIPREKATKTAPRIHLLPLSTSGGLKLISNPEEAVANELGHLNSQASPIVIAWSQYHRLVSEEKNRLFVKRFACPLVFHSPQSDESLFRVSLGNWPAARDEWLDEDLPRGRAKKQNISIKLKKSAADPETEATNGTIQKFSYDGDAWIDTGGQLPPEKGVLVANKESDRAGDLRRGAVERLQTADVALPVLLDILNDPALAARARVRGSGITDHRGLNDRQREVMERAVANDSVMAVQGPPGTGKTKVIVEIVRHLFLARRQNETLRVLISSTQNEAVWNAVTKLQSEGVLIHLNLSVKAEEKATESGLMKRLGQPVQEVQNKLESRIHSDLDLSRIQECLRVEELLTSSLKDYPPEPTAVLEKMVSLWEQWAKSPVVEMLSAWGEASMLRDRLAQAIKPCLPKSEATTSHEGLVRRCRELLESTGTLVEANALNEFIQAQAPDLIAAIGAGFAEEIRAELKLHLRSIRDGNTNKNAPHWARLRTILTEASFSKPTISDGEDIATILRLIESWRGRCQEQLSALRKSLAETRAGAIVEWQRALARDPQMWREICERYSQVVGATAQMAAPKGRDEMIEPYDYVIVDEAGRSDLFDLLIPMTLGRRILLVGDQQQLPPFIETTLLNRRGEADADRIRDFQTKLVSDTLFRELYDRLPDENRAMLNIQYRMHPAIGDAISDAFYNGELLSGPEDHSSFAYQDWLISKQPLWGLFENRPLVWIDSGQENPPRATDHNDVEIRIIRDLVQSAIAARTGVEADQPRQPFVGIIAFYSEQVRMLQEALAAMPETKGLVEIGTVDSFQGKEYPLTILSCCRHDPVGGSVGFLCLPNRVNVALSRAQRQLIIVGSASTMLHPESGRGSQPLKDFCAAGGENLFRVNPL